MPRQLKWELRRPYLQKCVWVCGCVCIRDRGHEYFSACKTVKE